MNEKTNVNLPNQSINVSNQNSSNQRKLNVNLPNSLNERKSNVDLPNLSKLSNLPRFSQMNVNKCKQS